MIFYFYFFAEIYTRWYWTTQPTGRYAVLTTNYTIGEVWNDLQSKSSKTRIHF